MYSENFGKAKNYPVSFSGTDGFALLERHLYKDDLGNSFTGVASQWQVIQNILNKLALPYNNIFVKVSTTSPDLSITDTIFHSTFVIQDNYLDEDSESLSCRDVLEAILKPYGCFIIQSQGNLYITDHNIISSGNQTFKKFNPATYGYIEDVILDMNLGDITNIGWRGTDQSFNVASGYNKQLISYSPYVVTKLLDFNADNDFSEESNTVNYNSNVDYSWKETFFNSSKSWNKLNNGSFVKMEGTSSLNENDVDSYLKINKYSSYALDDTTKSFKYRLYLPYIVSSDYSIKIEAQALARTIETQGNPDDQTNLIYFLEVFCRLKIGNRKLGYKIENDNYSSVKAWVDLTSSHFFNMNFHKKVYEDRFKYVPIDNTWTDLKYYTNLSNFTVKPNDYIMPLYNNSGAIEGGFMDFEIYGFRLWGDMSDAFSAPYRETYSNNLLNEIKDVRLKNIKITLIDSDGNEVTSTDKEYIGYMDEKYKNKGADIDLIQGSGENPTERGALLGYDGASYYFINS